MSPGTADRPRQDRAAAEVIRALGGDPAKRHVLAPLVSWVASIGAHVAVAALIVAFAATAVQMARQESAPPAIVIDFRQPAYAPTVSLAASGESPLSDTTPMPAPMAPAARDQLRDAAQAALASIRGAVQPLSMEAHRVGRLGGETRPIQVDFVGLRASNARRIVYVVDASGSLVGSFPQVVEELRRSLMKLDPRQQFGVIFFQRGDAVTVPPGGALQPATPENLAEAVQWIDARMIPAGRSNPLSAMEAAMRLKPEIIFLLSADITGAGEYEISERQLLESLDGINPPDPETGRRAVRIQCVQFLDPDPAGTLQRIATEHGGADGYRYLGRSELGLDPR